MTTESGASKQQPNEASQIQDKASQASASEKSGAPGWSRRQVVTGAASLAGLGAIGGLGAALLGHKNNQPEIASGGAGAENPYQTSGGQLHTSVDPQVTEGGAQQLPFYGAHQAGISAQGQAYTSLLGLNLRPGTDADQVRRLLMLLSDDVERLMRGVGALADMEPELATAPARLSVVFGFGPGLVETVNPKLKPDWLKDLPAFEIDRLQPEFTGGDLLLWIAGDDMLSVRHAVRMLLKDARAFADLHWQQNGFRHAVHTRKQGSTMRNMFGQVDGTVNPVPGTEDFAGLVWCRDDSPGWLQGGTSLVLRRIWMDVEDWDKLDRHGREETVGRNLDNGAPLTGTAEFDEPDFRARGPLGFPVIADVAHIRRARTSDINERFFRQAYNYDEPPLPGETSHTGLLFMAIQKDPVRQFIPVQARLAEADLLNKWTVPVGSAVFALPPGPQPGEFIGQAMFQT